MLSATVMAARGSFSDTESRMSCKAVLCSFTQWDCSSLTVSTVLSSPYSKICV